MAPLPAQHQARQVPDAQEHKQHTRHIGIAGAVLGFACFDLHTSRRSRQFGQRSRHHSSRRPGLVTLLLQRRHPEAAWIIMRLSILAAGLDATVISVVGPCSFRGIDL